MLEALKMAAIVGGIGFLAASGLAFLMFASEELANVAESKKYGWLYVCGVLGLAAAMLIFSIVFLAYLATGGK